MIALHAVNPDLIPVILYDPPCPPEETSRHRAHWHEHTPMSATVCAEKEKIKKIYILTLGLLSGSQTNEQL